MPTAIRQKSILRNGVSTLLLAVFCLGATGCTSLVQPIRTIPAHRVPKQFLAEPQASKVPIDFSKLRQLPPENYLLDKGDVLGVYVGGIIGEVDGTPPVNMPDPQSDLDPAIGFPYVIREDGTISLPLLKPINVRGLTVPQVEQLVFDQYTGQGPGEKELLDPETANISVDLMRKRTTQVFVIRQDSVTGGGGGNLRNNNVNQGAGLARTDFSSRGYVINLEAYKNDVLNALAETGGLPGVNAKAEITILRGNQQRWEARDQAIRDWVEKYGDCKDPCFVPPPIPDDSGSTKIPLRRYPDEIVKIDPQEILLQENDIVMIETRESELYYTGGALRGGQFPLPRDFDLDVLGAIAVAGGSVGATSTLGTGVLSAAGAVPPGQLIILRKIDGGGQIAISVDLVRALNDPRSNLLVKEGDTLILRYKPEEELLNFGLGTFFTYGIRELFRGN